VRLVAPFPPGGTADLLARVFAQPLSQALGQPVIVENRAGASGSAGTGVVAKSPPDGYTFVVVFDTHAVNPSLIPNLPFDTKADLAPTKTPPAIVARMNAELTKILRDPQISERLGGQGMNIVASSPEAFAKFIDDQAAKWARVVREHGIKAGD
jgi:tripartite-type tricarboxylate transporter receptor subunit TctC